MNASATTTVDSDEALVISLGNELLAEFSPASTDERRFLEAQFEFDKGPAWVHFPVGHGGLGLSPKLQRLGIQRVSAAGGPIGGQKNPIGYGMRAPAVMMMAQCLD